MESIRLDDMLPRVFIGESRRGSDVWHSSLTLTRGTFYQIEAASGAGKSSLCSYIFGDRTDFSGHLYFDNRDTSLLSPTDWQHLRRERLAYVPQELGLFQELTALENIRLKNSLTNHVADAEIREWLGALGIADRADWPAGRLSVGQRQRVAIIRALCQPFDFLLLDEPVSHLDETNNRIAAEIITTVARREGGAIISTSVGNPLLLTDKKVLSL